MGLLEAIGIRSKDKVQVDAQLAPAIMSDRFGAGQYSYGGLYNNGYNAGFMDRATALQVATVSRCRNLVCGVISYLPLELYKKSTGEQLQSPLWLDQPDIRQPRAVTLAYTVDSLIFYSVAYWRVTSLYADDGRPSGFEWVANTRVTVTTDAMGYEVAYYAVDGKQVPMSGIGSLVTFQIFAWRIRDRCANNSGSARYTKGQRGKCSHTDADWNNSEPGG
jgi:hypothetical protein